MAFAGGDLTGPRSGRREVPPIVGGTVAGRPTGARAKKGPLPLNGFVWRGCAGQSLDGHGAGNYICDVVTHTNSSGQQAQGESAPSYAAMRFAVAEKIVK
jgi:hypothetical protein